MKKKGWTIALLIAMGIMAYAGGVFAQDEAAGAPAAAAPAAPAQSNAGSGGFLHVIFSSGPLGVILWLVLFGAAGAGVYFTVDCGITIKPQKILPQNLIANVTAAMAEGDVLKALQNCENDPGPLANVLTAGFSHVEEGFEVIQESVATAADLETEKLMQKITWLSVCANLAPMLGLLGTVQGMIAAFSTLAKGAPDVGVLAQNIGQALYTTAGGLTIAVPCVTAYYIFRNTCNKIILRMEALTMELIKDLRNVEVVQE